MISSLGHVMTLANSIIGVGILAMPFCFQRCGILLSIILLVLNYLVTRISCHYLVKSSLLTRRKSFELLAFHAFGTSGKLMVELCIIGYLIGTCIAYFVVVGDLGPQIVAKLLNLNENDNLRTWVMVIVTFLCIIPLGMLKNVDSLSTVCTASIGFYFCLVLKVIAESEEHILANDWLDHVEYWRPSGILQCLPIFSMALSCQMQLFEVFETVPNQSLEKMNGIVKNATRICTCVYILVGGFGYVAFCTQTFSGNILVNFSQSLASDVMKMGFVLSVAFSFPLVIFPCRASIYSLLYRRGTADTSGYIPERRFKTITVCIALLSLSLGLLIPSIELVIGLVGSTIGVAICIMFPASCFLKISKKESSEKSLAHVVLIGGFCLMILGTYANLNAIDEKRSETMSVYHVATSAPNHNLQIDKIILPEIKSETAQIIDPKPKTNTSKSSTDKMVHAQQIIRQQIQEKMTAFKQKQKEQTNNKRNNNNNNNSYQSDSLLQNKLGNIDEELRIKEINLEYRNRNQIDVNNMRYNYTNISGNIAAGIDGIQNNLNKYAIQKDDEVAAEEAAKDKKSSLLQNAESELKKTKELLEKKVDELKLELALKNQETQNLVVAKLDGIVEKVEEIERQVLEVNEDDKKKEHEKKQALIKIPDIEKVNTADELPLKRNIQDSGNSTLDIQKDSAVSKKAPAKLPKYSNKTVKSEAENEKNKPDELPFEPLSYKTGEIFSKIKENGIIPLPLLINSTTNTKDKAAAIDLSPQPSVIQKNDALEITKIQLKSEKDQKTGGVKNVDETFQKNIRDKREADMNRNRFRNTMQPNCVPNCLDETKIENLFAKDDGAVKLNLMGIGRDLKSLKKK